jgi:hypothetical protein
VGSRGKKKTTFAKLARESKLRERRIEKQARKDARKRGAEPNPSRLGDDADAQFGDDTEAPLGDDTDSQADERPSA